MNLRLPPLLVLALILTAPPATAQEPPRIETAGDDIEESPWNTRVRLHAGMAHTPRADDPDEPSLLFGTAFNGYALRASTGATRRVLPWLRLAGDAALAFSSTEGFAERDDARRELRLSLTTLDIALGGELYHRLGAVELRSELALGPRFGASARARERRFNIDDDSPAPAIRVGTSLVAHLELGAAVDAGPLRIPFGIRVIRNLTYPGTTAGRLDGDGTVQEPGRYLVETTWQFLVSTGVEF